MICKNCGAENAKESIICIKCGKSLLNVDRVVNTQANTDSNVSSQINPVTQTVKRSRYALFDASKYRHYTEVFVVIVWVIYFLSTIPGIIMGFIVGSSENIFLGIILAIVGGLIGWVIGWFTTLALKIKIQEMNWRIDIHEYTSNI